MFSDCPAGLGNCPAAARNRRKATVKVRRNAVEEALSRKGLYSNLPSDVDWLENLNQTMPSFKIRATTTNGIVLNY